MKQTISLVVIILGIVLMLASATWGQFFPATRTWTTEKSEKLAELGSEANRLKFAVIEAGQNPSMHSGENPAELKIQYEQVREEYDKLHAEFENASESPQTMSTILRWAGIAMILIGAVVVFISKGG